MRIPVVAAALILLVLYFFFRQMYAKSGDEKYNRFKMITAVLVVVLAIVTMATGR